MESRKQFLQVIGDLPKDNFKYLSKLFQNCPEGVIKTVKHIKVTKDEVFIQGGELCKYVYIIIRGKAIGVDLPLVGSVYMFMEFAEMAVVGDFEVFGDIAEYRATIRAATNCELLEIPSAVYLEWMRKDVEALFMRTQNLMYDLTRQTSEERKWLFSNCKKRLMHYLVESFEKYSRDEQYKLKKTQAQLAERLGYNVRSVQRSIQELKKGGCVFVEAGKIYLTYEQYLKIKEELDGN